MLLTILPAIAFMGYKQPKRGGLSQPRGEPPAKKQIDSWFSAAPRGATSSQQHDIESGDNAASMNERLKKRADMLETVNGSGSYQWLCYDEVKDLVYCNVCRTNEGCERVQCDNNVFYKGNPYFTTLRDQCLRHENTYHTPPSPPPPPPPADLPPSLSVKDGECGRSAGGGGGVCYQKGAQPAARQGWESDATVGNPMM
eukprot:9495602-Pyramimonas_sp.AAC.1